MSQNSNDILSEISEKIDSVITAQEKIIEMLAVRPVEKPKRKKEKKPVESLPLDVVTLLSLPDNLRKTAYAISKLGEATAEQVANETERTRAMESAYLNQLYRMGHLSRKRKSHKVVYSTP